MPTHAKCLWVPLTFHIQDIVTHGTHCACATDKEKGYRIMNRESDDDRLINTGAHHGNRRLINAGLESQNQEVYQ